MIPTCTAKHSACEACVVRHCITSGSGSSDMPISIDTDIYGYKCPICRQPAFAAAAPPAQQQEELSWTGSPLDPVDHASLPRSPPVVVPSGFLPPPNVPAPPYAGRLLAACADIPDQPEAEHLLYSATAAAHVFRKTAPEVRERAAWKRTQKFAKEPMPRRDTAKLRKWIAAKRAVTAWEDAQSINMSASYVSSDFFPYNPEPPRQFGNPAKNKRAKKKPGRNRTAASKAYSLLLYR